MKALKANVHTHAWATKTQTKTVTVQQWYTETTPVVQHFVCNGCGADFTSEDVFTDHDYTLANQGDQSHMGYSTYNVGGETILIRP